METKKWILEVPEESNGWSLVKSFEKDICTIYGGQLRNKNNEIVIGEISNESKEIGLLISKAPEMLEMLNEIKNKLGNAFEKEKLEIEQLIKEATDI